MGSAQSQSRARTGDPRHHYAIYCDESGVDGGGLVGFGSLWMVWERRGNFAKKWNELHRKNFAPSEVKWSKIKRQTLDFYLDLVDWFFETPWLMFHCLVVGSDEVDLSHHKGDKDLARRKHFTMLLSKKLKRFARAGKRYRVRVDPIHSRYEKADEAIENILRNELNKKPSTGGADVLLNVRTVDSKDTPGVQLSDTLLGAVMAARREKITAAPKAAVVDRIASHLGWDDLSADTKPDPWKFNIWRFWNPKSGQPRPERTRPTETP